MPGPTFFQNDPQLERLRRRQAGFQSSAEQGRRTDPVATPLAALARVLTGAVGEFGGRKVRGKIGEREGALTQELAAMLSGVSGGGQAAPTAPTTPGVPGVPGGGLSSQPQAQDQDPIRALAMRLAGNQSTADVGLNLMMQNMLGEQQFGRQKELAGIKARAAVKPSEYDKRLAALRARGFSEEDAQDVASDRWKLDKDPNTGDLRLVNMATREVRPVNAPRAGAGAGAGVGGVTGVPQQPQQQPQPQRQQPPVPPLTKERRSLLLDEQGTLGEALNLAQGFSPIIRGGTGPGAQIASAADVAAGMFGGRAFEDTVENRNKVRQFNQEMKTALANNPRFPVAEMEIITRMLPDPDAFFTNPEAQVDNLKNLVQMLQSKQGQNQAQLEGRPITGPSPVTSPQTQNIATNPQTGESLIFNPNTGRWEPF